MIGSAEAEIFRWQVFSRGLRLANVILEENYVLSATKKHVLSSTLQNLLLAGVIVKPAHGSARIHV